MQKGTEQQKQTEKTTDKILRLALDGDTGGLR
jgi:hypothetical protein